MANAGTLRLFPRVAEALVRLGWETPEEVERWRRLRAEAPPGERLSHATAFRLAARHGLPDVSAEQLARRVLAWRDHVDDDERLAAAVTAIDTLEIFGDDAGLEGARCDARAVLAECLVDLPSLDAQFIGATREERDEIRSGWPHMVGAPLSDAVALLGRAGAPEALDVAALSHGLLAARHELVAWPWLTAAAQAELDRHPDVRISTWRALVRHRAALAAALFVLVALAAALTARPTRAEDSPQPSPRASSSSAR